MLDSDAVGSEELENITHQLNDLTGCRNRRRSEAGVAAGVGPQHAWRGWTLECAGGLGRAMRVGGAGGRVGRRFLFLLELGT